MHYPYMGLPLVTIIVRLMLLVNFLPEAVLVMMVKWVTMVKWVAMVVLQKLRAISDVEC